MLLPATSLIIIGWVLLLIGSFKKKTACFVIALIIFLLAISII